jgi:hypothetical protein
LAASAKSEFASDPVQTLNHDKLLPGFSYQKASLSLTAFGARA